MLDVLGRADVATPARAAIHLHFAERELSRIPGLPEHEPRTIAAAGVVGAGTMGAAIAMVFASAGIPVTVLDVDAAQLERGRSNVAATYASHVRKGRLSEDVARANLAAMRFVTSYAELANADLVVEAVFESMAVKNDVFAALDKAVKPQAMLASNTSTLDLDALANATSRPERVVGLHFFAPANVMALLEIVRGTHTAAETLTTALALAKRLNKKGVLSGNAFGFIGNRMLFDYLREASYLIEEGATPWQVDAALRDFGFAMGPFAMYDLSGIDVFYKIAQGAPKAAHRASEIVHCLYAAGRYGQKTGGGFFSYRPGDRTPLRDAEVERIVALESQRLGIARRTNISDREIVERCMFALVNAGAQLLDDGIALRPGDEDIVWVYGYGFPRNRGGPMWWADTAGPRAIYERIAGWHTTLGSHWAPAPALEKAASRGSFASRGSL